jgi:hypothetical protein
VQQDNCIIIYLRSNKNVPNEVSRKGTALQAAENTHVLEGYGCVILVPSRRTGAPYLARFSRDVGFHCPFPLTLDSSDAPSRTSTSVVSTHISRENESQPTCGTEFVVHPIPSFSSATSGFEAYSLLGQAPCWARSASIFAVAPAALDRQDSCTVACGVG